MLGGVRLGHQTSEEDKRKEERKQMAFKYCLNLSKNGYSVEGCDKIVRGDLEIPSMYEGLPVTGIVANAFRDCTELTSVTIPDSVTSIGAYAFHGCTGLISVAIGNGVKYINSYAFHNCTNLTSIVIPDNVTSIKSWTFGFCENLKKVSLPSTLKFAGKYVFFGCLDLEEVTLRYSNGTEEVYAVPDEDFMYALFGNRGKD